MGVAERRKREKAERRKMILDCARELILTQGVEHVSMEDIARRAELSKATVYLYFSGKEVLFNEICEEAARGFLEHIMPFMETGLSGIRALKYFWRGYMDLFGSSDEMIIISKVRNFLYPGLPFVSLEGQSESPNVDAILSTMQNLIDQCKEEGVFEPSLDSAMATRLLLSMFSASVDTAARVPAKLKKSPILIDEIINAFQIVIYGFAKEGIDRSRLDLTSI